MNNKSIEEDFVKEAREGATEAKLTLYVPGNDVVVLVRKLRLLNGARAYVVSEEGKGGVWVTNSLVYLDEHMRSVYGIENIQQRIAGAIGGKADVATRGCLKGFKVTGRQSARDAISKRWGKRKREKGGKK